MGIIERIDSNFRGNIYVVQNDKILCEYVTGFADLSNDWANNNIGESSLYTMRKKIKKSVDSYVA